MPHNPSRIPIDISEYDYDLPTERIAKFPPRDRASSKLLVWNRGTIRQSQFSEILTHIPPGSTIAFNNTKVVRARIIFHKSTGARIEIFCLEPSSPADYERAFAVRGKSGWHCMVGNSKKWRSGILELEYDCGTLTARRGEGDVIEFGWSSDETFGQLLEKLGKVPIPPYLERESEEIDTVRYQTVYSRFEGSVAAPTAGLHFTPEILSELQAQGFTRAEVTLHVGAGTFLPVKEKNAADHVMHTEFFDVTVEELEKLAAGEGEIIAVGTTTVRTLESLAVLGERVIRTGDPDSGHNVGQWEPYANDDTADKFPLRALLGWMKTNRCRRLYGSTQIMITPGYRFRTIRGMITNFHQPQSTLLLLVAAMAGAGWHEIYDYALGNDFRFLSYGDSSLLLR